MALKNRFSNRFISNEKTIEFFTAKDFKAGIIATLSNKNFRSNILHLVKTTATFKAL